MPGKRSKEGKRKREIRRQEYERQHALTVQKQTAIDYLCTHSMIARKNENYPVTEKVLTGSPEDLKALLASDGFAELEIDPYSFPEGLVIEQGVKFFEVVMP